MLPLFFLVIDDCCSLHHDDLVALHDEALFNVGLAARQVEHHFERVVCRMDVVDAHHFMIDEEDSSRCRVASERALESEEGFVLANLVRHVHQLDGVARQSVDRNVAAFGRQQVAACAKAYFSGVRKQVVGVCARCAAVVQWRAIILASPIAAFADVFIVDVDAYGCIWRAEQDDAGFGRNDVFAVVNHRKCA